MIPDHIDKRIAMEPMSGCWLWTGTLTSEGYGRLCSADGRRQMPAHRYVYQYFVAIIDPKLHVDHLCRNRACVNPDHLEAVTSRVNTLRGVGVTAVHAAKTQCVNGHAFDETNTSYRTGGRACRACRAEASRRYRAKVKTPK